MRIITGSARGINLDTLQGEETRPTIERAKEALFSMIQFDIEGRRCLDLFGGCGQLGLEALSRGAEHCVFCDISRDAADIIISNAKKTKLFDKCRVSCVDYNSYLKTTDDKFDLIFLDPPYDSGFVSKSLAMIHEKNMLKAGGKIICETDNGPLPVNKKLSKSDEYNNNRVLETVFDSDVELMNSFNVTRTALYGRVRLTVLENI